MQLGRLRRLGDGSCEGGSKRGSPLSTLRNKFGNSLAGAIKSEFSGDIKNALLALLMDPYDWYAMRLKKAFNGLGTCDKAVCRILGCNDKKDALKIAEAFATKYAKPLRGALKSELSGDYKRLAIAWVTVPDELEAPADGIEMPEEDGPDDEIELVEDEQEAEEEEVAVEPEEERETRVSQES